VDETGNLVSTAVQSGALGQAPGGPPNEFSVVEDPNAVSLTTDGMIGVGSSLPGLAMSASHLQSVLHAPLPGSHRHGLMSVDEGHGHGMISVGDAQSVIPVTDADGLMAIGVGHGPADEMLHVTDAHVMLQQFEHLEPPQSYDDSLEPPPEGEPHSKKARLFDDVKLDPSGNTVEGSGL
jgi:hypothetical protein